MLKCSLFDLTLTVLITCHCRQPFNYLVVNGNSESSQPVNVKLLDRAAELGWRRLEEGEEEGQHKEEDSTMDSTRTRRALPLSGAGFARKLHHKWYVIMAICHTCMCAHTNTHEHCIVATQKCVCVGLRVFPHLIHSKEGKVPLWVVAMFCNQGDNTGDAIAFADQFNKWTHPSSSGGSTAPHHIHTVQQQHSKSVI